MVVSLTTTHTRAVLYLYFYYTHHAPTTTPHFILPSSPSSRVYYGGSLPVVHPSWYFLPVLPPCHLQPPRPCRACLPFPTPLRDGPLVLPAPPATHYTTYCRAHLPRPLPPPPTRCATTHLTHTTGRCWFCSTYPPLPLPRMLPYTTTRYSHPGWF